MSSIMSDGSFSDSSISNQRDQSKLLLPSFNNIQCFSKKTSVPNKLPLPLAAAARHCGLRAGSGWKPDGWGSGAGDSRDQPAPRARRRSAVPGRGGSRGRRRRSRSRGGTSGRPRRVSGPEAGRPDPETGRWERRRRGEGGRRERWVL